MLHGGFLIKKRDLLYTCLLFPFFSNYYMVYISPLYYLTMVLKIAIISYVILAICYSKKHSNLKSNTGKSVFGRLTVFYMLLLLVSTMMNSGNLVRYLGYFISTAGWMMLTKYLMTRDARAYINALYYVFKFNIYIDAILLIIHPQGVVGGRIRYTFLGMDNVSMPTILCSMMIFILHKELIEPTRTRKLIIDLLVSIGLTIYLASGTGVTGVLVFLTLLFLLYFFPRKVNFKECFIILAIVFLMINILNEVAAFAPYIQDFLGKDLTFTDRTDIWMTAKKMIKQYFFWGRGIQENQYFILAASNGKYKPAHNEYLQVMLNGGIFYTVTFIMIILNVGFGLDRVTRKPKSRENLPTVAVKACLLGLMTMFLAETYGNQLLLFVILSLGDFLINEYENSNLVETV